MSTGAVRSAISEVIQDECLDLESTRIFYMKKSGKELLEKGMEMMQVFDEFCATLYSKLEALCESSKTLKSYSTMRSRLWAAFHKVAICDLPPVWDNVFSSLGLQCEDKLICQSTNEKLFKMLLTNRFSKLVPQEGAARSTETVVLTKDELNVLQYVGGFVPHALLKRFERHSKKYEKYFECLGDMAVGSDSSDFLEYTKEWISKVNRGGLFPLNNQTFLLFSEVEKTTRTLLASRILNKRSITQDDVIEKIEKNEEVQFHWTLISHCIDKNEDANWLLHELVKLYVTIRGFSMVAMWMELYKNKTKKCTSKSVELRKKLA